MHHRLQAFCLHPLHLNGFTRPHPRSCTLAHQHVCLQCMYVSTDTMTTLSWMDRWMAAVSGRRRSVIQTAVPKGPGRRNNRSKGSAEVVMIVSYQNNHTFHLARQKSFARRSCFEATRNEWWIEEEAAARPIAFREKVGCDWFVKCKITHYSC
jgi:hypothetical protein